MATTKIINDLIDLNQTGNTTALKGCVGDNANQPVAPTISVQYLVVGGGGGANGSGSGGGGAGGFSTGTIAVPNNTAVSIVIGQGGLGVLNKASNGLPAGQGQDSGFYTIQGQGGGAGAHRGNGLPGGSGGGGGNTDPATAFTGGSGVSSQGNNGGSGTTAAIYVTGGGGGAGAVGTNGISSQAGAGGVGSTTTIISTTNATTASVGEQIGGNLYFAGGGGGGGASATVSPTALAGDGGSGGGGAGSATNSVLGVSGTINTGGGGGGGNAGTTDTAGGSGGSGVVILRFASSTTYSVTGITVGNAFTEGSGATEKTVLVFKSGSGTINLIGSSVLGAKVGDLRTNTDQTSASSPPPASAMEHYMSTGWRIMSATTFVASTLGTLNYPPGKTAMAVYPLQTNTDDVSTNYNATNVGNYITFPGNNGFRTGTSAASFNGSSSVGLMQNSTTAFALQEFTYSGWIKPASIGNYGYLWSNYSNAGIGPALTTGWNGPSDKKITFWWRNGGPANPNATLYSNGDILPLAWNHICATFSNTTGVANIYINGNNTTVGSSTTLNSNQHPMAFGNLSSGGRGGTCFGQLGSHDTSSGFYNGLFQEIRIYDSALSSTDVGLLYTQQ